MEHKIPVLIDCDPGIDDAHALLLALASSRLDVRAITTVAGNMPLEVTTRNALQVVQLAGKPIPVSAGCAQPLVQQAMQHAPLFHGENGLGNAQLAPALAAPTGQHAVETMRQEIEKAEGLLHIITIGPLTNLATLLSQYPEAQSGIAHVTCMGGGRLGGNMTPHAEFNFFCDGEAADLVMRSGLAITLVDLAGCDNAALTAADAQRITDKPGDVAHFVKSLWAYNVALSQQFGEEGFVIHDAIAVASVIDPSVVETMPCTVRVETGDNEHYGESLVTEDAAGRVAITLKTDRAKFIALCDEMLAHSPA